MQLNLNSIFPFILFLIMTLVFGCGEPAENFKYDETDTILNEPNEFGLQVDSLVEFKDYVRTNETLTDILLPHDVSYQTIREIVKSSQDTFDVRKIQKGKNYFIYSYVDTAESVKYFVYVENPESFVVFDLNDSINVYWGKKEVEIKERSAVGVISNSLYETFQERDISPQLALKLSEVFAWQIDFYRIYKGDHFKVIFEEEYVDGEFVRIGKIIAALFNHKSEAYYGFLFEQDEQDIFFDEDGNSLRKTFLKAPIKFSRISSRYSYRRLHPILKSYRAHLGTDYSAPRGTPIIAVGDGVVTEAQYKRNNGRYVKIRHNGTYSTQYLHMSRFAKGMKPGDKVRQGQVIGYVGSTGLATGPHVCFRFWKNNRQIDHLREKFPPSHPVAEKNRDAYFLVRDSLLSRLDSLYIPTGEAQILSSMF